MMWHSLIPICIDQIFYINSETQTLHDTQDTTTHFRKINHKQLPVRIANYVIIRSILQSYLNDYQH